MVIVRQNRQASERSTENGVKHSPAAKSNAVCHNSAFTLSTKLNTRLAAVARICQTTARLTDSEQHAESALEHQPEKPPTPQRFKDCRVFRLQDRTVRDGDGIDRTKSQRGRYVCGRTAKLARLSRAKLQSSSRTRRTRQRMTKNRKLASHPMRCVTTTQ